MKLIYDVPNEPPIYLVNDDEAEYNATQLNAALPNAAPGTIITKAGFGTAKQKAEDGSWSPVELGGGGGSTVYLTTSTETNLNGLISGDGSNLAAVSVDASPTESSTNPVQSGGTYTALAGKAPTSHASDATTYGAGSGSNYGHVKLSDATDSSSDTTGGIAATPKAVKAAYDLANGKQDPITVDAAPTDDSTNPVQSGGVYDALALKAPLASPTLTGTPAAPTAEAGTNTTQIATTAFVQGELTAKAPLASPALTGTPTAPTATSGTNTTQIATTAFAASAITAALGAFRFSSYKQMGGASGTTAVTYTTTTSFTSSTYGLVIIIGQSSAAQPLFSIFAVHQGSLNTANAKHFGDISISASLSDQTLTVSSTSPYSRFAVVSNFQWS